jgi:hypothetical protein
MPTDESEYFRVILSEDKYFDASQGSFVEIIIEVPQKPRPRRRSDTQIPLIRLAVRLMIEHGIRTSQLERETRRRAARQTQRIAFTRRAGGQGWQFDCVDSAQTVSIGKPRGQISAKRAFVLVYG